MNRYDRAHLVNWLALLVSVLALIAAIIGIVSQEKISKNAYDHRYDGVGKASDEIRYQFGNNNNVGAGTVVMNAGNVWYGFHQTLGPYEGTTTYEITWKKSDEKSYRSPGKIVYLTPNDDNGDYKMVTASFAQSYDVRVERLNFKDRVSYLDVDFTIK